MTRAEWIVAIVTALRPQQWLALRYEGALAEVDRALEARDLAQPCWLHRIDAAARVPFTDRWDFAAVLDQLEHMSGAECRQLLARLRDLHAPRVAVCVSLTVASEWAVSDWRALHFEPGERLLECGVEYVTYRFDLATYNPQRSWHTPDHWAHPGNFDRYRW